MLRTYRDLLVWQRSYALGLAVFKAVAKFPAEQKYGLAAQLRKTAISIPSNIAEGYARHSTRDYVRFLWIANGSLAELETQLSFARDLGLGSKANLAAMLTETAEIERMLRALIRSLD